MTRNVWLPIITTIALLPGCSTTPQQERFDTLDVVRKAAQDLRWTKGSTATVSVNLPYPKPFVVLVLGPGTYTLEQRQQLVSSQQARDMLATRRYTIKPEVPSLYVFSGNGSEGDFFHDHVVLPKALAVWKSDPGPLQVSLQRSGDDVLITELR